ncbi:hypothetical protein FRC07_013164 [Ceratobasidium sp. 392]|nr:hypothetical protein FRC07_013164 [Ceratobasidium sp. 392]
MGYILGTPETYLDTSATFLDVDDPNLPVLSTTTYPELSGVQEESALCMSMGSTLAVTSDDWLLYNSLDPSHASLSYFPFVGSAYELLDSETLSYTPDYPSDALVGNSSGCTGITQVTYPPTSVTGLDISGFSTRTPTNVTLPTPSHFQGLDWLPSDTARDDDPVTSEDSDITVARHTVYRTLAMDSSIPSNSSAFILDSYSKWITRSVFDPFKLARQAKNFLLGRYTRSETSRCVTILKAHIVRALMKSPVLAIGYIPTIPALRDRIASNIASIKSKPVPSSELDKQEALDALGDVMELMSIHCLSKPLSSTLALIEAAAPIYRRACPEPPDELVNLRASLLHPEVSVRHFPAMDILFSVRTSRPMYLRYDTTDMPEFFENLFDMENSGLQWMQGMPDQFLVMLAKINMLREDVALLVDVRVINELELEIALFRPITSVMADALVNVLGIAIQEAWRQALYVYIYMGLAGVDSTDLRVMHALRRFLKLLETIKSGQNPDEFLLLPMIILGVAASRQRDRDIIRERMVGLRECSQPGTCGFDSIQIMSEIWAQADAEARPAVWIDLRLATLKVTGI